MVEKHILAAEVDAANRKIHLYSEMVEKVKDDNRLFTADDLVCLLGVEKSNTSSSADLMNKWLKRNIRPIYAKFPETVFNHLFKPDKFLYSPFALYEFDMYMRFCKKVFPARTWHDGFIESVVEVEGKNIFVKNEKAMRSNAYVAMRHTKDEILRVGTSDTDYSKNSILNQDYSKPVDDFIKNQNDIHAEGGKALFSTLAKLNSDQVFNAEIVESTEEQAIDELDDRITSALKRFTRSSAVGLLEFVEQVSDAEKPLIKIAAKKLVANRLEAFTEDLEIDSLKFQEAVLKNSRVKAGLLIS